ncbi:MAG: hypothetical protein ABJA74_17415 [Lapillicoccus sp.]
MAAASWPARPGEDVQERRAARALVREDRRYVTTSDSPARQLAGLPDGARWSAAHEPGRVELYAVLSCEAAAAGHPARAYFRDRFATAVAHFGDLFARVAADGS